MVLLLLVLLLTFILHSGVLERKGANTEAKDSQFSATPLRFAAYAGHLKVRMLVVGWWWWYWCWCC